jgi:hypothetical protein
MMWAFSVNVLAVVFFWLSARHLARDEDTRIDRARTAGEEI